MLQDIGTERAVLSGLCKFGVDAYVDVDGLVSTETFTNFDYQIIYKALQNIFGRDVTKVDQPILLGELKALNFDFSDQKKSEIIRSLFNNDSIYLENVVKFRDKIVNLQIARSAINKHQEALRSLNNVTGNEGVDEILSLSETPILALMKELSCDNDTPKKIGSGLDDYLRDKFDNPIDMIGIPTPFPIYNAVIGGGIRTGVTLIGARAKVGKSTLSKETAYHVSSKYKFPVLYLDTEMSENDQLNRMLASLSGIQIKKIETGKVNDIEREKIEKAAEKIKNIPFFHKRIAGKKFPEVLSIIRRWLYQEVGFDENGKHNKHLIIYDYFKLMDAGDLDEMAEHQALGFQISALSDFCGQYDSPVLAFVQLNRDGINNETTAAISQSDRLVWLCTSFSIFKRKNAEEIGTDGAENGNMKLIPVECRFGAPLEGNYINMNMEKEITRLTELGTQKEAVNAVREKSTFKRKRNNSGQD